MSKTKRMEPYTDAISMIMRREKMTATGSYDKVASTPSNMYDRSEHIFGYRSYWLKMSVVFTLNDILDLISFSFGGSKQRKNVALDVVDVAIFS